MLMIESGLALLDCTHLIQGMAAGIDLWSAWVAFNNQIPYTCARPWAGHSPRVADKNDYEQAMLHASSVVAVNDSLAYPGSWVYHTRNHWMVDRAEAVLAMWDGNEDGGTYACTMYALGQKKPVFRMNPNDEGEFEWLN